LRCFETWTFEIKVIFLVVLQCKKIKKCILPCENFNFVTKLSRNFAIFRYTKFREIRNKYFAKFRDRKISSTTLAYIDVVLR
jgi:hypothetical protein